MNVVDEVCRGECFGCSRSGSMGWLRRVETSITGCVRFKVVEGVTVQSAFGWLVEWKGQ